MRSCYIVIGAITYIQFYLCCFVYEKLSIVAVLTIVYYIIYVYISLSIISCGHIYILVNFILLIPILQYTYYICVLRVSVQQIGFVCMKIFFKSLVLKLAVLQKLKVHNKVIIQEKKLLIVTSQLQGYLYPISFQV